MSVSDPNPAARRLGSFDKLAQQEGVSPRTIRNYVEKGYFPVYKRAGVRGFLVDLDEAASAIEKLPRKAARPGYGSLGPNAVIIQLPARAEVIAPQGGDR